MPHIVHFDRVDTVHLLYHDWPIDLNLPFVRHLTLTNNLVALKSFSSFPSSIRSIQILLCPHMPNFISNNWSVLRSLSSLPMLNSLHIVLKDMETGLDEHTCQIIAETVPMFVHFAIYFRNQCGRYDHDCIDHYVLNPADLSFDLDNLTDVDIDYLTNLNVYEDTFDRLPGSVFDMYQASIEELHRRILRLPLNTKPLIVVEEEGYGLDVWL